MGAPGEKRITPPSGVSAAARATASSRSGADSHSGHRALPSAGPSRPASGESTTTAGGGRWAASASTSGAGSTPRSAPPTITVERASGERRRPTPPRRTGWRPGRRPRRCVRPARRATWHREGRPANASTAAATAAGDGATPVSSRIPARAPHRFQALCRPGTRSRRASTSRVPSTSIHPSGVDAHPPVGAEQRAVAVAGGAADRLLVAGTHRQPARRAGLDQAQLVPVVGLDAAVPVEVVGGQAGQHHHPGRPGHVGRLVRGDLDHVGVGPGSAVGLEHRHPDVPDQLHPTTVGLEDGGGQRRRRALALGPGDGQHRCVGVVLEPHRHRRGHRHPGGRGRDQFRAVATDPRRPHDHVTLRPVDGTGTEHRSRPAQGRRHARSAGARGRRRPGPAPTPRPMARVGEGQALGSHPPDRHPAGEHPSSVSGPGVTGAPASSASTAAATSGSGKARPCVGGQQLRHILVARPAPRPTGASAETTTESRQPGRSASSRRATADSRRSPTHSNGLSASLIRAANPSHLGRVGEHVGPDDGGELGRLQERCQHQSDEAALRTVSAPTVVGVGLLAEGGVAAAEGPVVPAETGERPGDGQFGVRAAGPTRRSVRGRPMRRTRSASSSSNSRLFEYWWLTGTPSTDTVSSLAERSTAMATVS